MGLSDAGSIAGIVCTRVRLGCEGRGSDDGEMEAIGLEAAGSVEDSASGPTFSFSVSALTIVPDDDVAGSWKIVAGIARLDISTGFDDVGALLREGSEPSCVLPSL